MVITVPADGLAPISARPSPGTMVNTSRQTIFEVLGISTLNISMMISLVR